MSFDFAVWSHIPRTGKDAPDIYERLCEGDATALQPHPTSAADVRDFLAELTARYPTDDAYPDDRVDECLWSSALDVSDVHVLMGMPFSRAAEVIPFVTILAEKHNLTSYNPQSTAIRFPSKKRQAFSGA